MRMRPAQRLLMADGCMQTRARSALNDANNKKKQSTNENVSKYEIALHQTRI